MKKEIFVKLIIILACIVSAFSSISCSSGSSTSGGTTGSSSSSVSVISSTPAASSGNTIVCYVYVPANARAQDLSKAAPAGYAPLEGARVTVVGQSKSALTNSNGYAEISNIVAGTYTVTVGKQGYQTFTYSNVSVNSSSSTTVGSASSGVQVQASSAPAIVDMDSLSGVPGTRVTITGFNFGDTQGASGVTFNGASADIISWSASQIICEVPDDTSSGNVIARVSSTDSNSAPFTVIAPDQSYITTVSPINAAIGDTVTITGGNFRPTQRASKVYFNDTQASVAGWSNTQISCVVPDTAVSGPVKVVISGVTSNTDKVFYLFPRIISLSASSGAIGDTITISGSGFGSTQGTSLVKFNDNKTADIVSWGKNQIICRVPSGAVNGTVVVRVNGVSSDGVAFTASSSVIDAACGYYHTMILKSGGTLWACGDNSSGYLGFGSEGGYQNTPAQVTGITNVADIDCGDYHTAAIKSDGTLWVWGCNTYGQLGLGDNTDRNAPVQISGLTNILKAACGFGHTAAVKSDGTAYAWGYNGKGQLGLADTADRNTPVQIAALSNITDAACGYNFTVFLKNDGTVWACGDNAYGQLGLGDTADRNTPTQIAGLTNIVDIECGFAHVIALKNDGTLIVWGSNIYGELGLGDTTNRNAPAALAGFTDVSKIAAGYYYYTVFGTQYFGSHTIAVKTAGTVWACGWGERGQLGSGFVNYKTTFTQVQDLTDISNAACGAGYTVTYKNNQSIWAFGNNMRGKLGLGDYTDRFTPVQVPGF